MNQNQTFVEETQGHYMWSPKTNKNGARNQFYDNMADVRPGDAVFSFSDTRIKAIGIIGGSAVESPKPTEFGDKGENWARTGWRVATEYFMMDAPVRPKDFIEELRPLLPEKYSPLQRSGDGLQSVYLAAVPEPMAHVLLAKLRAAGNRIPEAADATTADAALRDAAREEDQVQEVLRAPLPETEKRQIVLARVGQGRFRQNIIDRFCRVCGITNESYLRASHIKPWRDADNRERLDGANGLLLAPHVDHLFDAGLMTFDDDGRVILSARADGRVIDQLRLDLHAVPVRPFRDAQKPYLLYHREHVFKQ